MRILDVGCGINKKAGSIGLDRNPASRADVLADLDRFPYPFRDSSFDALQAVHVIEHVSDVIRSMEEFHRLVRPGGEVLIVTPHYTDFSSFCDPTHRWHLNSFSLRYFGEDHGGYGYYSTREIRREFRAREATSIVAMAGIRMADQRFPALPALLGILSLLHRPRQSDRVASARNQKRQPMIGARWTGFATFDAARPGAATQAAGRRGEDLAHRFLRRQGFIDRRAQLPYWPRATAKRI